MKYQYLIELKYDGFNYHGWQKQKDLPTIQSIVEKTLASLLGVGFIQTIAASRTDSMVSANQAFFLLRVEALVDEKVLIENINKLLPSDIFFLSIQRVDSSFRIISSAIEKEYHYYFCFGREHSNLISRSIVHFSEELDISLMQEAAHVFIGRHSFHNFCHKTLRDSYTKEVKISDIVELEKNMYCFKVVGDSFMRHQVRLMMGALLKIGLLQLSLNELQEYLKVENANRVKTLVPPYGLCLYRLEISLK